MAERFGGHAWRGAGFGGERLDGGHLPNGAVSIGEEGASEAAIAAVHRVLEDELGAHVPPTGQEMAGATHQRVGVS